MKAILSIKNRLSFFLIFILLVLEGQSSFSQPTFTPKTPYPIIFIHGINSNHKTWQRTSVYGIIDFLTDGGTPLVNGGNINISLDYQRNATHLNTTKEQDVHLFSINPFAGDIYTVNFDVHATSGDFTRKYPDYGTILAELNGSIVFDWQTQIFISNPDLFKIFDIIRIGDELMEVIGVDIVNNELIVNRGVLGSEATMHIVVPPVPTYVYNLSTEGNHASIAKQGFGLKKAINIIKQVTGAEKVILVGHSMGGLAAREYIQSEYYENDVAKVITIGTPHKGSDITVVPNIIMAWFGSIDGKSEAARDLRTNIQLIYPIPGVYLFGGSEDMITGYYDKDVNCNGTENDYIHGLNQFYYHPFPENISRTWIVSSWLGLNNDGAVFTDNQFINSGDTLRTEGIHTDEPTDIDALIRGLDEPSIPDLAYKIGANSINKGFITFQKNNNPTDIDLYKVVLDNDCILTINISGNSYSSINQFELLNEDQDSIKGVIGISNAITYTAESGTYFIRVKGTATAGTNPSYQYPYTLTTHTDPIVPTALVTSPVDLIEYYDLMVNHSRDKIIELTNNGSATITISGLSLSGSNNDQFAIIGQTTFDITPGSSVIDTVRFNPTSIGVKNAMLVTQVSGLN